MGIQINNKRTDSYIGTFDYNCADDMLQLQEVRNMVKNMNKSLRSANMDYQFRVIVRGRGDNRFERAKDYYNKKYGRQFSERYIKARVAQDLPLEFADRVDAYILRRR
jgi:hypothetical protein